MFKRVDRKQNRKSRHYRVRNKVFGTSERPRLNVYKSGKHIYLQIIDDNEGRTLVSASTLDKSLDLQNTKNMEAAKTMGETIAKRAIDAGISEVVFDRGGHIYHGKIKAIADAAREAGLKF